MQKIAYSTLAIAAPVVLQGCSDEDEQTTAPPVDCSAITDNQECMTEAVCNWNTPDPEPKNCSRAEVDVSSAGNDSVECAEQFGGIVSQQCKPVQECSAYNLAEANTSFDDLGDSVFNGIVDFDMVDVALGTTGNFVRVYFSNANTGTFNVVGDGADNPDNLCVGYIFQNDTPGSGALDICPDENCSETTFNCGLAEDEAGSFQAAGSFDPSVGPITIAPDFGNNTVYDADFYDACSADTLCGMQTDGTCQVIQDFCAQFDGTNCPIASNKDNVRFIQGQVAAVPVELISDALVCEYIANIGDFIPDADGNDTEETYDAPFGCRTVEDLELPTCEGSPFPSDNEHPAVNPLDPEGESILIADMCNFWLADDKDWNAETSPRARPIYSCPDGQINDSDVDALACVTAWNPAPGNNDDFTPRASSAADGDLVGRACTNSGSASFLPDFDKQCALPRNFTCDIATDANGDELEECSIGFEQNNSNVCVYDNGNRDFCGSTDGASLTATEDSGEGSVEAGVRGADDDNE